MAITEQAAVAGQDDGLAQTTDRNSILIENQPKPETDAQKAPSDEDKYRLLADRLGNELGEARKSIKELTAQVQTMAVPQVQEAEPASFADDPESFIQQSINNAIQEQLGPQLNVLNSDLLQRKSVTFDQQVAESYPDWKETANSADFADWVKASPARVQMYQIADSNYDAGSAVELIKRFKQDQAEAASQEQGAIGAASLVQGGGDSGGARVYAASEIQHMIETDRDAYNRWMAADGIAAYRDGRVDQSR